jgi:hypothetical protein
MDALQYANTYTSKGDASLDIYDPAAEGRALAAKNGMLWDFGANQDARAALGENIEYIGYPGSGKNYIGFGVGVSISAVSAHKDAAWELVRTFFEDTGATQFTGFPTNANAFARMADIAMENGATQADIEAVKSIIAHAAKQTTDFALQEIVYDEAETYFSGMKSAEEVARNIQSRVSIYLSEQYG